MYRVDVEYLCEIAHRLWIVIREKDLLKIEDTSVYSKIQEFNIDTALKFYEYIFEECKNTNSYCDLLSEIWALILDERRLAELYKRFMNSF